MNKDLDRILLSESEISEIVDRLAKEIDEDFKGEEVKFIIILKGSIMFATDLMRRVNIPVTLDFMVVSSYGSGSESSGNIKIKYDLSESIEGQNVIIIEDIIDSGNTLSALKKNLLERNPKSLKLCTMLDKPERRQADISVDYVGAEIPDEFVVGYGLDYSEHYRELPYIGILSRHIYE